MLARSPRSASRTSWSCITFAADTAAQHALIQHRPERRRPGPVEDTLPVHPCGNELLDLVLVIVSTPGPEQRAGILRRLEQARHQQWLPPADNCCPALGVDPVLEPARIRAVPLQGRPVEPGEPPAHLRERLIA